MTRIRAAVGRYRFGRVAAVAVALYLVAVVGAAAVTVVSGYRGPLVWVAGVVLTPSLPGAHWLVPALIGIGAFKAWMWWMVLRGPALPRAEGLPPGVVWARRLLYASVACDLVLWELLETVSHYVAGVDLVADVASPLLWAVTMIILIRVVLGVPAWFKVLAVALGLIGVLISLPVAPPDAIGPQLIWLLGLASCVSTLMILVAQRRDGRWSDATINFGRIAVIAPLFFPLLRLLALRYQWLFDEGEIVLLSAHRMCSPVWLARTAHELATPPGRIAAAGGRRPGGRRVTFGFLAVVIVLPLVVVRAEEDARYGFTGADEGCRDTVRSYAETPPQERRKAFLCLARSRTFFGLPMFPDNLPDQRVLAYGEQLCAVADPEERQATLRRIGGSADDTELGDALQFLCPDVVAREGAETAREQARLARERERERAEEQAEMNARCADPWPSVRARRQGTAAYLLFEGGGYAVHDDRDHTEGPGGDVVKAIEDGFIDAAGSSAAITTYGENEPMCLTVKAFAAAPPLRLKGWDRVVEVGIVSRSGRLVVPPYPEGGDSGALRPLPNLAVNGPGRYRLRVYARTLDEKQGDPDAPLEEHLIVVYPGRSTKKIAHVPWR